jgi:hypothetical protein
MLKVTGDSYQYGGHSDETVEDGHQLGHGRHLDSLRQNGSDQASDQH